MIKYNNFFLDVSVDEIYKFISNDLKKRNLIKIKKQFLNELKEREKKGSLYIGNGILLPHFKSKNNLVNSINVYRLKNKIEKDIDIIIVVLLNEFVEKFELKEVVKFIVSLDNDEIVSKIRRGEYGN